MAIHGRAVRCALDTCGLRMLLCVAGGVAGVNFTGTTAFRYCAAGVDGSSMGPGGGTKVKAVSSEYEGAVSMGSMAFMCGMVSQGSVLVQ